MKTQELPYFSRFKQFYKYADDFEKINPKVSYQIKYFVSKTLYNNKNLLNELQINFLKKKFKEF